MPHSDRPRVTVYLHASGYWYYNARTDAGRVRASSGTRSEAQARAGIDLWVAHELPHLIAERRAKEHQALPGNPTIDELADYYTQTWMANKGSAAASVVKAVQVWRDFARFCADEHIGRAQQLNAAVIDRYQADLRERKKSPKTIAGYLALIRAGMNAALEGELIAEAPIRKWRLPRCIKADVWAPNSGELRAILALIRSRDPEIYPMVYTLAMTGLRPSDIISLEQTHLDRQVGRIERRMTKTGSTVKMPLAPETLDLIASQTVVSPKWVFVRSNGTPWTEKTFYNRFVRAAKSYPQHVTPKTLRHAWARIMLRELAIPMPDVSSGLGHSDIRMTMQYTESHFAAENVNRMARLVGGGSGLPS